MAAGILTLVGLGIGVGLILCSKKFSGVPDTLLKKSKRLSRDLKGKFSEFVDQVTDKMQGVLK